MSRCRIAVLSYEPQSGNHRARLQLLQAREGAAALLEVVAGTRCSHGVTQVRKQAADADVLRAIPGADLRSMRHSDIEGVKEGLQVTIRRSKTDQEGVGAVVAIPEGRRLQPKVLLAAWLEQAGVVDGFLFRRFGAGSVVTPCPMSDRAVARLVQARAAAAGYDPENFAGHSLRAGFLTAAARSGASVFQMQEVSRHKSMQVLAGYVRDAEPFHNHGGGFL